MRYIEKAEGQPDCIRDFFSIQFSSRTENPDISPQVYAVDYGAFGSGFEGHEKPKEELMKVLLKEQGGLCAYTGTGIDDRLPKGNSSEIQQGISDSGDAVVDSSGEVVDTNEVDSASKKQDRKPSPRCYKPHIEHLKPQSLCKGELRDTGREVGIDVGEDMDYHNMVGALEVGGSEGEHFGAVARKNALLPVLPTQPDCEAHFSFDVDGNIKANDEEGKRAIDILRLDHKILTGWRRGAIDGWMKDEIVNDDGSVEDISFTNEELREHLTNVCVSENDRFEEFCYAIASAIKNELGIV
ncbi:MAG: hypothetical protein NT023_20275 [Armatimonadetes bacterium]|nr:hypothetical protein [Armatimonadota bacterium]